MCWEWWVTVTGCPGKLWVHPSLAVNRLGGALSNINLWKVFLIFQAPSDLKHSVSMVSKPRTINWILMHLSNAFRIFFIQLYDVVEVRLYSKLNAHNYIKKNIQKSQQQQGMPIVVLFTLYDVSYFLAFALHFSLEKKIMYNIGLKCCW